ncbi:MAG: hypothetical protein PVH73_06240 [Candidatus Bathyarchaeota archaeon]|jgi:hypothetical protein
MGPDYLFFMIVPLIVLVVFLIGLRIYRAGKEEDDYEKELKRLRRMFLSGRVDKKGFLNMRNRLKHEKIFTTESKRLLTVLSNEKIDEETYVRLRQVLEKSFRDRLEKLDDSIADVGNEEFFDVSRF